jgi:signal transduction histidine kinase
MLTGSIGLMPPNGLLILAGAAWLALAQTSSGQRPSNWRVYKAADGLPQSASISVTVSPAGKVLVKHFDPPSVSELDGYSIKTYLLPEASPGRAYRSPAGQIWTTEIDGLLEFRARAWISHPLPEMTNPHPAVPFYPIKHGCVVLLFPDRLLEFSSEDPERPTTVPLRAAAQTQLERFSQMSPARDGGLWISGSRGLAKLPAPLRNLRPESLWQEFVPPAALQIIDLQEPHEDEDGGVTTVAESAQTHEKLVVHFDGQQWTTRTVGTEKLRQARRGPDKTFWAASSGFLFQGEANRLEMIEDEEISAGRLFDVATEPGGAFWLATSEGLFRCAPLTWRSPDPVQGIHSFVHCLAAGPEGQLWFVSGGALCLLHNEQLRQYPLPAGTARSSAAGLLFPLKDGSLVFGVSDDLGSEKAGGEDRLFRFVPARGEFRPVTADEPAGQLHALGLLTDGSLCVQRLDANVPEASYRLEKYDGIGLRPLSEPPPERLLGAVLYTLFAARNGDLWLSGERGTACFHDKKWRIFASTDKTTPEAAHYFVEEQDGKICCAAADQLWEFDGQNWRLLRRGFDRINGLARARDGSLWVASNSGLLRLFQGASIENGLEEGLPSATVREIYEDPGGRLWAGTFRGLSLYHPEADPDPPQAFIQGLGESDSEIPQGGTITLRFGGQDKWKYTPRERLLYSYRLDEREWSAFADVNGVSFSDLPVGKHYFQVRAMDRNGNIDRKPTQFEFAIILPWYEETRLVLISSAGLATALFFAGLAFNRHRRLVRSYAEVEKKVAERTRELEIANRELLHSQKMNALGALAAGIAHDFNNILSIVKGSAQIIEDNLDNPQKVRTRVDRIKIVVEQGAGIVKAMLGFSRDSGQQPESLDLNEVVEETVKLLGDRFLREVQVEFKPGAGLPPVLGLKNFIQQILLNFVFNAAESGAGRRQIILATRRLDKLPANLVLTPAAAAVYAAVSVQDFGCGIPPENMSRIFEPFFTTKALSTRRGTGLGLSMVYELAKRIEAGLAVESVVEKGSTFTLILPISRL